MLTMGADCASMLCGGTDAAEPSSSGAGTAAVVAQRLIASSPGFLRAPWCATAAAVARDPEAKVSCPLNNDEYLFTIKPHSSFIGALHSGSNLLKPSRGPIQRSHPEPEGLRYTCTIGEMHTR